MTFLQAQQLGGRVKRGEQGSTIVFFKMHQVRNAKSDAGQPSTDTDTRVVPLLRSFTVFNVDQVEGLPPALCMPVSADPQWSPIDHAEELLKLSGAAFHHGGTGAARGAPGAMPEVLWRCLGLCWIALHLPAYPILQGLCCWNSHGSL